MSDERGMTLAEMLIAVSILALVAITVWGLTSLGLHRAASDRGTLTELFGQRLAISRISADIRAATVATAVTNGTRLQLTGPTGQIEYWTDAAGALQRRLNGGATVPVAARVGTLTFVVERPAQAAGGSGMLVSVTAISPSGSSLTFRVAVRRP